MKVTCQITSNLPVCHTYVHSSRLSEAHLSVGLNPSHLRISVRNRDASRPTKRRKYLRIWYPRTKKNARCDNGGAPNPCAAMHGNHLTTLDLWNQWHDELI